MSYSRAGGRNLGAATSVGSALEEHAGNWLYVNRTQTAGAAFPSGSCAFPIPSGLPAGGYELRLYTSSWALLASTTLTLTAASSGATINVTPGSGVAAGGTLTVSWSALPSPAPTDRIGLYAPGGQSWLDWIYLSCSKTAGSTSASGSCAFTLPATLANGSYEMRLLKSSGAASSFTDRGFTGHEHVKTAGDGIIHMNGRVYDANLGRFLSPDPYISLATNSQDFNRYSYVLNNPLSLTDPTGYSWLSKLWKKVVRPFIAYTVGTFLCGNPFCGAALSGAVQGYSATHTFEGALRGAGAGLIAQGVVSGIGALANEIGGASSSYWNMLAGAEPEIRTMSDMVVTATRVRTIESTFFEILTSPTKLAGAVASAYASAAATISSSQTLSLVTNVASGFIPGVDAWRAFTTPGASTFDKVLGVASLVPGGGKLVALGIKGASRGLAHLVSKAPMEALGDIGKGGLTVFYGTDATSAANILDTGLSVRQATELGGGDVFWTTTKLQNAHIFAAANPVGGTAAVLRIDVPGSLVESLQARGLLTIERDAYQFGSDAWGSLNRSATFSLAP